MIKHGVFSIAACTICIVFTVSTQAQPYQSAYARSWAARTPGACEVRTCAPQACAIEVSGCGDCAMECAPVQRMSREMATPRPAFRPHDLHAENARMIDGMESCYCLPQYTIRQLRERNDRCLQAAPGRPAPARVAVTVRAVAPPPAAPWLGSAAAVPACPPDICDPRVSSYERSWSVSIRHKICADRAPVPAIVHVNYPPEEIRAVRADGPDELEALHANLIELRARCMNGAPR